ncbi:MAG: thiol:disulfide interchange protein DsbA/DsbL [Betaproteobacteria bacterium]
MQRRHFSALAAASLGLGLARNANAQGGTPVDGQDYRRIATPAPVSAPPGTADVVEFFSFACPHCFDFEPVVETWLKRKPAGIRFRRAPVRFLQNYVNFQPMYFALEAMDLVDAMQLKVFNAVHLEHQRLDKPEAIAAFMTKNGVDATRFMGLFNSFGVRTKVQQANALMDACGVEGVPALAVQGRFLTSPLIAKGEDKAIAVAEYLAAQVRAGH